MTIKELITQLSVIAVENSDIELFICDNERGLVRIDNIELINDINTNYLVVGD